jgi:hypothetical protein
MKIKFIEATLMAEVDKYHFDLQLLFFWMAEVDKYHFDLQIKRKKKKSS